MQYFTDKPAETSFFFDSSGKNQGTEKAEDWQYKVFEPGLGLTTCLIYGPVLPTNHAAAQKLNNLLVIQFQTSTEDPFCPQLQ